jgi:hypothetical protein
MDDVKAIAQLLKALLRYLPIPLFPFDAFKKILELSSNFSVSSFKSVLVLFYKILYLGRFFFFASI